jgi:hypothetical protein
MGWEMQEWRRRDKSKSGIRQGFIDQFNVDMKQMKQPRMTDISK